VWGLGEKKGKGVVGLSRRGGGCGLVCQTGQKYVRTTRSGQNTVARDGQRYESGGTSYRGGEVTNSRNKDIGGEDWGFAQPPMASPEYREERYT